MFLALQQTNLPGAKKPKRAMSLKQDGNFFEKSAMFIKHCAIVLVQTFVILDSFKVTVKLRSHRRKRFCDISILFEQEQTEGDFLKAENDLFVNIFNKFD